MWMIQRYLTRRAFTEQAALELGMEIAGEALKQRRVRAQVATATLLHPVVRYNFISKPIDNEWSDPIQNILYFSNVGFLTRR